MSAYVTQNPRLNYAGAARMIAASVDEADRMGVPVVIVVMDPAGQMIAYARTDGAADLAAGPALAKARVASERRHPSGALPVEYEAGVAFATGGAYTNLAGGLQVLIDGAHVGGIAASGGSGAQDLAIVRAGLAAIGATTIELEA
ncbi:MAG: heme-binding protein [Rhodobacteraceae bacterium]|nr:heme-binding protein [Paracoccaceae bacterium]